MQGHWKYSQFGTLSHKFEVFREDNIWKKYHKIWDKGFDFWVWEILKVTLVTLSYK